MRDSLEVWKTYVLRSKGYRAKISTSGHVFVHTGSRDEIEEAIRGAKAQTTSEALEKLGWERTDNSIGFGR